jgi:Ca-activated chloride channel family protein
MKNSQHEKKNKEMGKIALKGVSADIKMTGSICHTTLSQNFMNQESQPIEAVYSFPLPMNACVNGFSLIKNGQETIGVVKDRDEALESYEQALSDGDSAYLLDQDRPNIFSISAGNLMPGENIIIKIKYSQLLEKNNHAYRLILPTTIAPLYTPAKFLQQMDPAERDRIYPPISTEPLPYGLSLKAEIVLPGGIKSVESPSHTIKTSMSEKGIHVEFSADSVKMDRDFVLKIEETEQSENYALLMKDPIADGYIAMTEINTELEIEKPEQDLVFIVDCSGSMSGESIEQAKNALLIMLSSLSEGDRFNMIAFGSHYKLFSDRLEKYEDRVLHLARKWVESLDADMGGTEILSPIEAVYDLPFDDKGCDVILLTDGAVGNQSEIIDYVKHQNQAIRFFTLGVGYGADEYLLHSLADTSGGAMEKIHPSEKIESAVLNHFKKTFMKSIKDAKIKWSDQYIEQIGNEGKSLFKGQNFLHFSHLEELPADELTLSLTYCDETTETYTVFIKTFEEDKDSGLAQLYAKFTIDEKSKNIKSNQKNDIARLALLAEQYGILSKYTSFVLTDPVLEKKYTSYEYRRIPSLMMFGMKNTTHVSSPVMVYQNIASLLRIDQEVFMSENKQSTDQMNQFSTIQDNSRKQTALTESSDKKKKNPKNTLINVISLQKASGCWGNSEEMQDLNLIDKDLIQKITEMLIQSYHISPDIANDVAISLLVLNLFEHQYVDQKNEWEHVYRKCEKWLNLKGISQTMKQNIYQMI